MEIRYYSKFQIFVFQIFLLLGIEGNVYPITTMAYIEDIRNRMTLIVDHASAATSTKEGTFSSH